MDRQEAESILRTGAQRYHGWGYHDFLKLISYSTDRTVTGQEGTVYALKVFAERIEAEPPEADTAAEAEADGDASDSAGGDPPTMPTLERGYVLVRFEVRDQEDRGRFRPSIKASLLVGPGDVFDGDFDDVRHRYLPRLIYRSVQLSLVVVSLAAILISIAIVMGP